MCSNFITCLDFDFLATIVGHPLASISPSLGHPHQSVKLKKVYSTCCVDLQHLTHHLPGFSACEIQFYQPEWSGKSPKMLFSRRKGTPSQVVRQISDIKSMIHWCILYIIYFISNVSYMLYLYHVLPCCIHLTMTKRKGHYSTSLSAFFPPRTLPWCRNHQLCHWQLISSADVQLRSLRFQNLHQLKFVVWVRPRKKPSPQSWLAAAWPSLP